MCCEFIPDSALQTDVSKASRASQSARPKRFFDSAERNRWELENPVLAMVTERGILPMQEVRHISIYIDCNPNDVYEFAANPENLPRWAAGLARSEVKKTGDAWVAEAPFGRVKIRFAEKNPFGVMDHDVELDSGVVVHNPMRVVPNGGGSEFMFTLFRQPGMSEEQFAEDKLAVEKDLRTLKEILEDFH